jgi:drug/metabolite transporter (DMT)-like permease
VQRDSIRPYIWMLMGCAFFTLMYTLVHLLRDRCDWQVIALVRTGLAFTFALALALAAGAKLVFLRPPSLWIRSLAGSISLVCSFFAMTRDVPVSNVLAINNIFPIWVSLFAWPMLGIRPGWQLFLSAVTAVTGVFLIRLPQFDGSGPLIDLRDDTTLAAIFALVASFATAVAMLGLNRLHWIDTRAVVAHFSGVSMIFCLGALLGFGLQFPVGTLAEPLTLLMLLGLGVTATAGQICLTKAFTIGAPAKVAVVSLTQIVMTLVIDVCLFDERFTAWNLLGISLVMLPTAWIVSGRRRKSAVSSPISDVSAA